MLKELVLVLNSLLLIVLESVISMNLNHRYGLCGVFNESFMLF